jgi:hypothetical protein
LTVATGDKTGFASLAVDGEPVLSVLVPAYNEKRTIRELLSRIEAAP